MPNYSSHSVRFWHVSFHKIWFQLINIKSYQTTWHDTTWPEQNRTNWRNNQKLPNWIQPDETRRDQTGPDRTRQDQTGPDITGTRPDRKKQDQTRLDQTGPYQTRLNQTKPDWITPDRIRPDDQTRSDKRSLKCSWSKIWHCVLKSVVIMCTTSCCSYLVWLFVFILHRVNTMSTDKILLPFWPGHCWLINKRHVTDKC